MLSEKIQTFCKDKGWWYDDHRCIKHANERYLKQAILLLAQDWHKALITNIML
mgnify:CR=1 FL=1